MKQVILTTFVVLLGLSSALQAQPKHRKEKIEAMKIAYITKELNLTTDEAQKFWPVYNEMKAKMDEIHEQRRANRKKLKNEIDSISDVELEQIVDEEIEFKQKEAKIIKEYHTKFKEVLPIKKVAKLYKAEKEFHKKLIQRLGKRGRGGPGGHHGPPPEVDDDF